MLQSNQLNKLSMPQKTGLFLFTLRLFAVIRLVFAQLRQFVLHPMLFVCVGLIALCENMPSGKALKPGDVVIAKNRKSIQACN